MPTFLGSLRQAPEAEQEGLSKLLQQSGGVGSGKVVADATPTPAAPAASTEEGKQDGEKSKEGWTPSGGKKLSTGLAICLGNTASGMARPCVLDLKLGARLWDDDAPVAKRQKLDEVAAGTTSGSLGFRVAGMKVWVGDNKEAASTKKVEEGFVTLEDGYKSYDKWYGRQFKDASDVKAAFQAYLPPGKYQQEIGKRFVRELESVVFMLENTESRMYSASLLFVYDGDDAALGRALEFEKQVEAAGDDADEVEIPAGTGTDENDEEIEPKVHDVRLIDFAHASWTPGKGPDENALRGVRNALKVMREVLGQ